MLRNGFNLYPLNLKPSSMQLHFNSKGGKISYDFSQGGNIKILTVRFLKSSIKQEDIPKIKFLVRFEYAGMNTKEVSIQFRALLKDGVIPKDGFEIEPVTASPAGEPLDTFPWEYLNNVSIVCQSADEYDLTVDVDFETIEVMIVKVPSIAQLKEVIASGDDSRLNSLVLKKTGEFELLDITGRLPSEVIYPDVVGRFETFADGNGYVGPDAAGDDDFISNMFNDMMELWKIYRKTGKT